MLQSFRNQKRWLMLIAMILIIPAFVFIGVSGYSRLNPDANAIAKVDGKGIQPEEFEQAKRQFIESQRARFGQSIDVSEFDTPEVNQAILNNLITERTLNAELAHRYMNVSEADAINVIKQAEAFQKDGKFDPQLYENFLASRGKSDQQFVYELRGSLAREMLINGVKATTLLPKAIQTHFNNIMREERTVRTLTFDPASYMDQVKITEDEIKAYYEAHKSEFRAPETVNIEYIVLSPDTITVSEKPNEEILKQFYENNKARFGQDETRRASHILIEINSAEKDAQKANEVAKQRAEKLMKQLKANPSRFAELAKKESADLGSAEHGGDVDFFARGQMVPEFEKAVFDAKKGDLVGPVKTDYGYHIIKVTDISPARVKAYKEVLPEITQMWVAQQKQSNFAENADNFSNMVYEQSDSLEPVAEKFGLKIVKVDGLTRTGFMDQRNNTPYINRRIIEEIFSSESLDEKRNTQALEVATNTLVSARVTKHIPEHQESLAEVSTEIRQILENEKAGKLALQAGEEKLKTLQSKTNLEGFSRELTVSRLNPNGQSLGLVQTEMEAPADKLPAYVGYQDQNGSYVISYVMRSQMPKAEDENSKLLQREIQTRQSLGEELAYYDALKKVYQLEILKSEYRFNTPKAMN